MYVPTHVADKGRAMRRYNLLNLLTALSFLAVGCHERAKPAPVQETAAVGGRIAFTSTRDGNDEIYTIGADGGNPVRLTNHRANDWFPAWSPDGRRIAFVSERHELGIPGIYVMDADGGNPTRLLDRLARYFFLAWSPDGTRIAFTSGRDGDDEIYVMAADGSEPRRLTNQPGRDTFRVWAPIRVGR